MQELKNFVERHLGETGIAAMKHRLNVIKSDEKKVLFLAAAISRILVGRDPYLGHHSREMYVAIIKDPVDGPSRYVELLQERRIENTLAQ
jgi:hypothetical protein